MKIGILIDRLNFGGVEKIAIEQTRALIEIGVDAELVVLREKAVVENAFIDLRKNLPIRYLDSKIPKILKFSFKIPLFSFFSFFHISYPYIIPRFLKKNEYDYLIVHGTYTSMTAKSIKKRLGISYSAFIWDPSSYILERVYQPKWPRIVYSPLHYFAKILDIKLIKSMDSVLVGGSAHNGFIKNIDKNKDITTIYPSVRKSKSKYKKKDYFLAVTAWKDGKNPEYLIELAQKIPELKIKMAGKWLDSGYQASFTNLIKNANLQKQIEILGEVTEKQLEKLYGEAFVVIQTNDDRGFGMPALEGANQGTTFIIPKGQGVCELFTDTKDGFYTNERDTKQITTLINNLLRNPDEAYKLGQNAKSKVMKNYTWEKHAEKLLEVARKYK